MWYWACVVLGSILDLSAIVHGLGKTTQTETSEISNTTGTHLDIPRQDDATICLLLCGHLAPRAYLRRLDEHLSAHMRNDTSITYLCAAAIHTWSLKTERSQRRKKYRKYVTVAVLTGTAAVPQQVVGCGLARKC